MASGKAVITTNAPCCKETVVDGKNGYLVPVKDVKAIIQKMEYMIEHPEVTANMGLAGRKIAKEKFSVDIVNGIICESMGLANKELISVN